MEIITSSLDSDIISDLPRNVTDTILTCLPLRDAVRTSILSRKWRYCWINLPKLVFDETMFKISFTSRLETRYRIISIIWQVLVLHQGPLLEFNLSHSFLESCSEIDNIIMFLSKNRVEDLTLNTSRVEDPTLNTWRGKVRRKYKLPSTLFSCRELTHLNLSSCIFTPPRAFEGFRRLISLKIVNVDLPTDLFGSFVNSCPQLERLTVINPSRFYCLRISAPNLKYLHVEGSREQIVIDESEKDPHLKDGEQCKLVNFSQRLPALNTLITSFLLLEHLAIGGVPEKLLSCINLKFLKLFRISFDALDEVTILFTLISSLSMQRIEVQADNPQNVDETPVLNFLEARDCSADIMFYKLQEVRLKSISGIEAELKFIKILLAKSPVLEVMFIQSRLDDVASNLELLKKLTRFKRSSPMVEMIYE